MDPSPSLVFYQHTGPGNLAIHPEDQVPEDFLQCTDQTPSTTSFLNSLSELNIHPALWRLQTLSEQIALLHSDGVGRRFHEFEYTKSKRS